MAQNLSRTTKALSIFLIFTSCVEAFYIPGWSIKSYAKGDAIPLLVNKVYSDNTELQYAYYDLPFVCPPTGHVRPGISLASGRSIPLNIGEILRGDRIVMSDLELDMQMETSCKLLCDRQVSSRDLETARDQVREGYTAEWIVDNLPGATSFVTSDGTRTRYYAGGFKMGSIDRTTRPPRYFLYNHHSIVIRYRKAPGIAGSQGRKVIVGFEVYPRSIGPDVSRDSSSGCPLNLQQETRGFELTISDDLTPLGAVAEEAYKDDGPTVIIPYTYSVQFVEDTTVKWDNRWDLYFADQEEGNHVHWLAILNSLLICAIFSGIAMTVLARTVRGDIKAYRTARLESGKLSKKAKGKKIRSRGSNNSADAPRDTPSIHVQDTEVFSDAETLASGSEDEHLDYATGWKKLYAEVFYTPSCVNILPPLIGTGMQLLFISISLLLLGAVGVLNPSLRGGFISFALVLFILTGLLSGYFSALTHRAFSARTGRVRNALMTAVFFPSLLFTAMFTLNLVVWAQASSTAIPFGTLAVIVLMWLCVQVPLVYVGSAYGFRNTESIADGKTHLAPMAPVKLLHRLPWYLRFIPFVLLCGFVPFTVISVELLFFFRSLWQSKTEYYYVFGFLAVVAVVLLITVAEVAIVAVYAQLCAEDPRWWWSSFLAGASCAIWVFGCSVWYFYFRLHVHGLVNGFLFFGYSFIACCTFGLLTGTIGFLSAYVFIKKIYGAIKSD